MMRQIILQREKKFGYNQIYFNVYIDRELYGTLANGQTGAVEIDSDEHELIVSQQEIHNKYVNQREMFSKPYIIPANDLDYYYHVSFITHMLEIEIVLTEDEAQKRKNNEILSQREHQQSIENQIMSIVNQAYIKPMGKRDFSALSTLNEECRNSTFYRRIINVIRNAVYQNAIILYNDDIYGGDIRQSYIFLSDLLTVPEFKAETQRLMVHWDYFFTDDPCVDSVLPSEQTIKAFEVLNQSLEPIRKNLKTIIDEHKKLEEFSMLDDKYPSDDEDPQLDELIQILFKVDYPEKDLDMLKRLMIVVGSNWESKSEVDANTYKALVEANQKVFKLVVQEEINGQIKPKRLKSVDMIITEAFRCSHSGRIESIDQDLQDLLKITCPKRRVAKSQYAILLQVFDHLKAYKEEKMVLQAMVDNMIERTSEQEKRLAFLQNYSMSNDVSIGLDSAGIEHNDDEFLYEYRTIGWTDNEIKSFFAAQSAQKVFSDMPYAVAEWTRLVSSSIKWDIEKVQEQLQKALDENYDDRFVTSVLKTGINSDWVEYMPSISIVEGSDDTGYPWLVFNVIGENVSKKQISFTVYALYVPEEDSTILLEQDLYKKNDTTAKKVIALKNRQNPRWNVHIDSIVNIIVSEIEAWINKPQSDSIYG